MFFNKMLDTYNSGNKELMKGQNRVWILGEGTYYIKVVGQNKPQQFRAKGN